MSGKLSLPELVTSIETELARQADLGIHDIPKMKRIMESFDIDRGEWKRYQHFQPDRYTRNLIATDDKNYALMLLCWEKGVKSCVHDHSNSECWLLVVDGEAREEQFEFPESAEEKLVNTVDTMHSAGACCHIDDNIGIHCISNVSTEKTMVSLHCYSPPYDQCHMFLNKTGKMVVSQMKYYSENGEIVKD